MAINNTGAMFKSFEFDGTDSRDFGVYITGAAVYNAPEREVEMISIPNRNGAFALDKGRFENIEITYPAGIYADNESDFAEGISDLRNFLCSKRGYCRLTDEYNPNEYRMAIYKSGLEVEPSLLKAGEFEITFECMPQRYLNSGDEEIEVGEWGETETKTGDIVTIDNTDGLMAVKSLNVSLLPVQEGTPTQDSTIYNEPYLSKTSPSFNSEYDKLVGGTVAWNQQIPQLDSSWTAEAGVTATYSNGVATITSTTANNGIYKPMDYVANHRYLVSFRAKTSESLSIVVGSGTAQGVQSTMASTADGAWHSYAYIATAVNTSRLPLYVFCRSVYTELQVTEIQVTDLTQMFGTAIADYVYSLEQSTAGSGIAWLRSYGFFTEDYYEYNAGELISTKPTAHVTSETYPLAGVELRGIPKISNGALYYDGDTYESDGTVARKWRYATMSELVVAAQGYSSGAQCNYVDVALLPESINYMRLLTNRYPWMPTNDTGVEGYVKNYGTALTIYDSRFTDIATATTILTNENFEVVYPLSTPTTETVTGFTSPQEVGTTESYTDNRAVPIPVGHESRYADIYPITGYDNTIITDSNGTDTTTKTVTLPHTVYGAGVGVTSGSGKEKWKSSTLNGSENWLIAPNDPNGYFYVNIADISSTAMAPILSDVFDGITNTAGRGTPNTIWAVYKQIHIHADSTIAPSGVTAAGLNEFKAWLQANPIQVCYELATPTDLQTTPTDVELLTGVNNISSPQGEITIEYGQNPNIVINPTLFDAKPMLEVYGYGTINIGSKIVTLYDQPVGDIVVAEQGKNSFSTTTVEIDDTYANLGDEITFERIFVQTDSRAPNNQYIYTPNISASGTDVTVSADVEVNGRQLLTTITLDSDSSLVFAYGTSKSVSAVANSSFTVHGSTVTSTTTIGLSYDGDKTFTLSRSVTFSQAGYALMMNNTFNLLGPTHLNSTQNLLGNPTYIDLSIGEAYRIDGDSAASLNNAVVLPIELPTLPKGETEITFDNTVTRLDIVPRWWKI